MAAARGGVGDFHKLVVVKMLRPSFGVEEEVVPMFLDEARLSARLNHPNVVQTYDVGQDSGRYYITMEFMEGESYEKIRHHPRSAELFFHYRRHRMYRRHAFSHFELFSVDVRQQIEDPKITEP